MSASELERLAKLRDDGHLTEAEFKAYKRAALNPTASSHNPTLRIFALILGVLAALLALWYVGSPRWTLYQIGQAIEQKDADKFGAYVNFELLAENLKERLMSEASAEAMEGDNPFAMLGIGMLEGMADKLLTKRTLVESLQNQLSQDVSSDLSMGTDFERIDFNNFRVRRSDDTIVYFARDGLAWRMSDIDRPANSNQPVNAKAEDPIYSDEETFEEDLGDSYFAPDEIIASCDHAEWENAGLGIVVRVSSDSSRLSLTHGDDYAEDEYDVAKDGIYANLNGTDVRLFCHEMGATLTRLDTSEEIHLSYVNP